MPLSSETPSPAQLLGALSHLLGQDALVLDPGLQKKYLVDWVGRLEGSALAIVKPSNAEEVAQLVRWSAENHVTLVPQGGNTGLVGGATPVGSDRQIVVSLERLNGMIDLDPIANTITVGAGVILQDLQEWAREAGRFFPLSLGAEGSCQIGGCISTNAGGTAVLRFGNTRDLVLGLEVVLPDGRIWSNLKALRKDNAGYDLKHLFIGSEGTLGIVTAATLKLFPTPRHRMVAMISVDDANKLLDFFVKVRGALDACLTAFEFMTGSSMALSCRHLQRPLPLEEDSPFVVLVEASTACDIPLPEMFESILAEAFENELVTNAVIAANESQAEFYWTLRESIPEAMLREFGPRRSGHDVSVPISRIPAFLAELARKLSDGWPALGTVNFGHVGDGNLHINFTADSAYPEPAFQKAKGEASDMLYRLVDEYAGSISAEHGIGVVKRVPYEAHVDKVQRDLAIGLKRSLDRLNLLNPGKVVGPWQSPN